MRTIRLPLRRIFSTLPAVALIGGGIMFPAPATSTAASGSGLASESSPVIVLPSTEVTLPSSSGGSDQLSPQLSPRAPASLPPAPPVPLMQTGALPGSSSPVTLDRSGIPIQALEGYRTAAALIGSADPSCHLDWALVGAIGRVESDHGRFAGNQLDAAGTAQPGIIGIPLDGSNATARITDTDHGRLDHDTVFDRAVGPMQFIPGTWAVAGVDANGDGVKDPQNIADAATATSAYLCSGGGDLGRPADLRSAILRYNPSDSYVSLVIAIADAYRHGVRALPASVVSPVQPSTAASRTSVAAGAPAGSANGQPVTPGTAAATTKAKATAKAKATVAAAASKAPSGPALTPRPLPTSVPAVTQVPAQTVPGSPTTSTTAPPAPTTPTPPPNPTTTCVAIPSATSPAPTSTLSAAASPRPAPAQTCLPACAPGASPTSSASPTPVQTCLPPCPATAAPTSGTSTATALACLAPSASVPSVPSPKKTP